MKFDFSDNNILFSHDILLAKLEKWFLSHFVSFLQTRYLQKNCSHNCGRISDDNLLISLQGVTDNFEDRSKALSRIVNIIYHNSQ